MHVLVLACVIGVIADILFVNWGKSQSGSLGLLIPLFAIVISSVFWAYSIRTGMKSSTAITMYSLLTISGCSTVGYFVFHENLSTLNLLGIILALIAIILVNL